MVRRNWKVRKKSERIQAYIAAYEINPLTAQILINRGIAEGDIESFLNPSLSKLFSPHLLPDVEIAARRIKKAIKQGEKICLYGDYDVDGIISLILFGEYLKGEEANFSFYIPDRLSEGYGLNAHAIKKLSCEGVKLLVCLDCGTNSAHEIALAQSLGLEVIVVDHHHPKEDMNHPLAFVNPKRKEAQYPFTNLSSGALAFKVVQVLSGSDCQEYLDLVSLSIVCDVVPLVGENRILLAEGILRLRESERLSITTLCKIARIKQDDIDIFHIGYILGPRINASGRIRQAKDSLELFLIEDPSHAHEIALRIEETNRLRKNFGESVFREAVSMIEGTRCDSDHALVVAGENWHVGVLGIVASRLVDKYYRPAFVLSQEGHRAKGSGRSTQQFHLMNALNVCAEHLVEFGGHQKAAGVELFTKNIDSFREKLNTHAQEILSACDLIPVLEIDAAIDFSQIDLSLITELNQLKPFGEGNPEPFFLTKSVVKKSEQKRISSSATSFWLSNAGFTYEALCLERDGFGEIVRQGNVFDIVYALSTNHFHQVPRLFIKDIRLAS